MYPRTLFSQIFAAQVMLVIAMVVAGQISADRAFRQASIEQMSGELEHFANAVSRRFESGRSEATGELEPVPTDRSVPLDARVANLPLPSAALELVDLLGHDRPTRFTVIKADGTVILDTERNARELENHASRPEIREALAGRVGHAVRWSSSVNEEMLYVAVPMIRDGTVTRIYRASRSVAGFESTLRRVRGVLIGGGIALSLLAAFLSYVIARRLVQPIEAMKQAAKRYGIGDEPKPIELPKVEELAVLARALNRVGARVHDKFQEIIAQRNERDAVLGSMVEAVVAIDTNERIVSLNPAAGELFGLSSADVVGHSMQETVRNSGCERVVREVIDRGAPLWRDISDEVRQRLLQVHGAPLRDAEDELRGVVLVISDVTQLRRLEGVRRDFVANVSHELKTPLTAISGFVETLLDGAMKSPADCERFLRIISNHVGRMQKIITDLLTLSTLEQADGRQRIVFEETSLRVLTDRAIEIVANRASEKGVMLLNNVPPALMARVNTSLFEQAIMNLIDNAVKFSPAGARVEIRAESRDGEVALTVTDNGPGIHRHHHERLFERFYRVDMARARNEGGTGLGLSIVKHIAQAHGGRVHIESSPGEGSTFEIIIPAVAPRILNTSEEHGADRARGNDGSRP